MEKNYSSIMFIDRLNYENLLNACFKLDDIPKAPYDNNPNISQLTKGTLLHLNKELNKLLYFSRLSDSYYDNLILLNDQEKKYIEDNFDDYIKNSNITPPYIEEKKYYEIIILGDNTILVVVKSGFLTFVTESKDNFTKFILDCLCYQYKFNFKLSYLMKTYISLKLNDNYFNLIKSRYF